MWLEVIFLNFLINIFPEISGFVNLANTPGQKLQGTASWNVAAHSSAGSADKAVDGDTRQDHLPTCAVADYGAYTYKSVWWKVWLNRKLNIAFVEVYLRSITTNRATGFSIYTYEDTSFEPPSGVTGTLLFKHDPMSGCPGDVQKINVNKIAQGIAFFNERPDGFTSICSGTSLTKTSIEICEVKVMGCDQNRYSVGCVNGCDAKCKDRHCDAFNGSCIYGCSNPGAVSLDCIVCVDGTYASNGRCEQCGQCKDDQPCNKGTGNCSSGCKKNWTGHLCKECADGYYDEMCSTQCGNCLNGVCDKKNGNCPSRCTQNWKTPLCQECVDGFYDQKCTSQCGQCREGFCDKINGSCSAGCKLNWKAPFCQECTEVYYGHDCRSQCGQCLEGFCNKINGRCSSGCKLNWKEPLCQECVDGHYDKNCTSQCGQCLEGFCDKINGRCLSGCKPNWKEPMCQECIDGRYDENCTSQCGHCLDGFCDKKNGSCLFGCKQNWKEPLCQECVDGNYGENCTRQCGNCLVGVCDKTNGSCMSGCSPNWQEPLCRECVDGFYNEMCSKRCGHCLEGACDKTNGTCKGGCSSNWLEPLCQECIDGFYDQNCSTTCGNCRRGFCDKKNGRCLSGCITNWKEPFCKALAATQEENKEAVIIGRTVPAVVLAVLAGVVLIIIYRRLKNKGGKGGLVEKNKHLRFSGIMAEGRSNGKDNETEFFDGVCNPRTDETDENGYYNTVQLITNINIEDLGSVINEKSTGENSQFRQEYKRLPPANLSVCQSATKTENKAKNRFKTTFPYEHSRIILNEIWTDSDNDYINANFISDCKGDNRYIAAQGPRENTLRDFWRMIWQEDIKDIVMLTNIVENGKNKCTQYWPDKGKSKQIGLCNISLREETVYAFHTLRKLSVERKEPPSKRIITQFHYTAWPDHGTPQELELVQFHRFVTKRIHTDVPLLVHCSAGVGRTGTFIGLDSLLTQGRETGRINVFEFVKQMRENRMTMVQTPEQYVFLHEALNCGFQGDFLLSRAEFTTKSEALLNDNAPLNQRVLYKEFKILETLNFNILADEVATNVENTKKNFSKDILPVSKFRPYLTTYVKGKNDYINAVMVPSYINPTGFIITQKPLPDTEDDLWRLCFDHEVAALVVLNAKNEANNWLPKRGTSKTSIPFTLTAGGTGSNINGVSQDHLVISSDNVKKEIEVFQVQAWDNDSILKATELVLEKEKQSTFTYVVLSKDGAGTAGIFCVLHNALQQINKDGEVDIFTIVRQLKVRRPEVITKLEEYRRCYQLVFQSVLTEGIYANM